MAVKIRLQRHGRGKRPFYHIVATDSRSRRDGQYIERLGDYNPLTKPATINIDVERAADWLMKGAEPTDTANAILKYKGVLYKKHLLRGVAKGALSQEEANRKFDQWVEEHKNKVLDHQHKLKKEKADVAAKLMEEETRKRNEREAKRAAALAAAQSEEQPASEEAAPDAAAEEAPAAE